MKKNSRFTSSTKTLFGSFIFFLLALIIYYQKNNIVNILDISSEHFTNWKKRVNFTKNPWNQSKIKEAIKRNMTYSSDFYSPTFEITENMFQDILDNIPKTKNISFGKEINSSSFNWDKGNPEFNILPREVINDIIHYITISINTSLLDKKYIYMSDSNPELCQENNGIFFL